MKKILLVIIMVISFSSAVQARENLRVLFLFDKDTTNYTYSQKKAISKNLLNKLNKTFANSNLQNTISFYKAGVATTDVTRGGAYASFDTITWYYRNSKVRTGSNHKPKKYLHYYQRYYKADLVVTIFYARDAGSTCGESSFLPDKNEIQPYPKSIENAFAYADGGQVFLHNSSRCLNNKNIIAHEVGHTFGLRHGKAVSKKRGVSGDYDTRTAFEKYAHGYGRNSWYRPYGTVMAGIYLTSNDKRQDNRFSDGGSYNCGQNDDDKCGDSTANAVKFIKKYAKYYNMRGDWYR